MTSKIINKIIFRQGCGLVFIQTFFLMLSLTACGGGGGGGGGGGTIAAPVNIQGGAVKGPLVGAEVRAYAFDSSNTSFHAVTISGRVGSTNQSAEIEGLSLRVKDAPFILEYSSVAGTTDLTTGQAPVIKTLRTYVTGAMIENRQFIYATPLTTMALDLAIANSNAGISIANFEVNLSAASSLVVDKFGFGMRSGIDIFSVPPLLTDDVINYAQQSDVVGYRAAIESISALAYTLEQEAKATNSSSIQSADDMLSNLAMDLTDGNVDGAVAGVQLAGFNDVDDFSAVITKDPNTLLIPGTTISVSDIAAVLATETSSTGVVVDTTALTNGSVVPELVVTVVQQQDQYLYPRLIGVVSVDNVTVLVSFNKPMSASALNPANYSIVQTNINDQAGVLLLDDRLGQFVDNDPSVVRLHTKSQNELFYTLTATNLKDADNQALDVVAGVDDFIASVSAEFAGTPPSGDELVDSDGDGISDNEEQRGYVVNIVQSNGEVIYRDVTSDPLDETGDTDGDGVSDLDERQFGSDPRSVDTDGDGLDDNLELNSLYSHPAMVDTDGDGLEDGLEFITLSTSPILADTDGDQLDDDVELFERFRDPRIADLPKLSIVPGDSFISLNETYSYTTEEGELVVTETSSTAQLTNSEGRNVLTLDEKVVEDLNTGGIQGTIKFGLSESKVDNDIPIPFFINAQLEVYGEWSDNTITTTGTDTELFREAQKVLEDSYAKGNEISSRNEVTRTVDDAVLNVALSLRNKSDIAFTVTDVEITVLQLRPGTRKFEPIATMLPQSGDNPEYQLGPFNGEIGPLVFTAQQLPVDVAEGLMRNASGLAFQVANYTITDEFGRQFTYINQEVQDVTAGLVIDYGFSGVDRYQIAASAIKGEGANEVKGGFNAVGRPTGIALTDLLENQLGWVRNSTILDAIVAGSNGVAESVAVGDDIQRITVGTRGLEVGTIVVDAGPNGVLDSGKEAGTDDEEVVSRGYQVSATCGTNSTVLFKAAKACSAPVECLCTEANGCPAEYGDDSGLDSNVDVWPAEWPQCDGPNIITRVGAYRNLPGSYRWVALTNADTTTSADVDSILMKPGDSFKLAFVQDLDGDGLFSRVEFLQGSVDSPMNQEDNTVFGDTYRAAGPVAACVGQSIPLFCQDEAVDSIIALADSRDTDRDGMDDPVEVNEGWTVAANGQPRRQVYSSPTLRDSDGDGLTDKQERDIRFSCAQVFLLAGVNREVDVDNAGPFYLGEPVSSEYSIVGYPINYLEQASYLDEFMGLVDDPWSSDEPERRSLLPDYNDETVSPYDAVAMIAPYCVPDLDIGTDTLSRAASLDPTDSDTDGDGIPDGAELLGYDVSQALIASVDFDAIVEPLDVELSARGDDVLIQAFSRTVRAGDVLILPGGNGVLDDNSGYQYFKYNGTVLVEVREGVRIRTNPLDHDTDDDLLSDGVELSLGLNPNDPGDAAGFKDSDEDGIYDVDEYRGFNIQIGNIGEEQSIVVYSNATSADTDGDGLPDFVEYQIGSNPGSVDTDDDGLSDNDELALAFFDQYASYAYRFNNFSLDASQSMNYGTSLTRSDSDDDGINDGDEVIGFEKTLIINGLPESLWVQTNPLAEDTDGDGVSDSLELSGNTHFSGTNPMVADTDGDGRSDGDEVNNTYERLYTIASSSEYTGAINIETVEGRTDPTEKDILVRLTFQQLSLASDEGASSLFSEWNWKIFLKTPERDFPGWNISNDEYYFHINDTEYRDENNRITQFFPLGYGNEAYIHGGTNSFTVERDLNSGLDYYEMKLNPGDSFMVSGEVTEAEETTIGCASSFLKQYQYSDIVGQGYIQEQLDLSSNNCIVGLRYLIEVR